MKILSFDHNVPIYLQLVQQILFRIVSGDLSPGERVLSVREWALREQVNPNTMQKALSELEVMGLIVTERTNGKYVTSDPELINACKKREAHKIANRFFDQMSKIGLDRSDALAMLENMKGEND